MRLIPLLVALLACGTIDARASGTPATPTAIPEVAEPLAVATPRKPTKAEPKKAEPQKTVRQIPEIANPVRPAKIQPLVEPKPIEPQLEVFWDDCPACGMG